LRGTRGPTLILGLIAGAASAQVAPVPTPATPPAGALESIVVTSDKLSVETRIDRKIYSVKSDLQSEMGSVGDVLGAIPSIDVDSEGVVSLRGDTNVLILVDGHPSAQFSGPSAGDNLQAFPARDIERIEVITNPPAQYKADGAAGIINIITRKKHQDGVAGSLQASLGSGGRSLIGGDVAVQRGPLTLSLSSSYRQDVRQRRIQSDLLAPDPATGQWVDNRSSIDETIRRNVPPVSLQAQYAFNDRQTLSVDLGRSGRAGPRRYTEVNDSLASDGSVTGSTERLSSGHDREVDFDQRLGFSQTLARPGEKLDLTVHRAVSRENEHYDYLNEGLVPPAPAFYDNLGFHEDRSSDEFGADYALPLSQARLLKLGFALEKDDYGYGADGNNVDPLTGAQTADALLTDDFKYGQQIEALYGSYQAGHGDWTWLAGLRGELTRTVARQLTQDLESADRYLRLYPSLHVDRSLSDASTLSFAAGRRVTRPDPDNLNPFVDYEYTPNLRAGNPNLRPQDTHSYEIGYAYEAHGYADSVTGYYRRNRDTVTDVIENVGNGLTLATKTNLPANDSAGFEFSSSGHIVGRLAYTVSGNWFYNEIDATALGASGLQSTTGLNAKVKLDWRPTAADSGQITLTRTDRRLTPQGTVAAIDIVNIGYKRQLPSNFTALVTVSDVFDGQRYRRTADTPSFTEEYSRRVRGRVVYVGFAHSFGSVRKDKPAGFDYDQ
jgi:outer membrane receptor protein involved in Fe transport